MIPELLQYRVYVGYGLLKYNSVIPHAKIGDYVYFGCSHGAHDVWSKEKHTFSIISEYDLEWLIRFTKLNYIVEFYSKKLKRNLIAEEIKSLIFFLEIKYLNL